MASASKRKLRQLTGALKEFERVRVGRRADHRNSRKQDRASGSIRETDTCQPTTEKSQLLINVGGDWFDVRQPLLKSSCLMVFFVPGGWRGYQLGSFCTRRFALRARGSFASVKRRRRVNVFLSCFRVFETGTHDDDRALWSLQRASRR